MRKIAWLLPLLLLAGFSPVYLQNAVPIISLSVDAGYNGLFRENAWFPLLIQVSNEGDSVTGRLVVRPERTGDAFTNTFSAAVEMPSGSRKSVMLYVTARSFATDVQVEFIDENGFVAATQAAPLRSVALEDQLHVVLSQSSVGSIDLSGVSGGGYRAFQANWRLDNLPDRASALSAVDTLVFSDIDTSGLSSSQRESVADWLTAGGHLIVTGGANWQATAAGLEDLLPITPQGSESSSDLDSLFALGEGQAISGTAIISTGTSREDARILAATESGTPLLARRSVGLGTVDYLALDPMSEPLRSWDGLDSLWQTLASLLEARPGWSRRVVDYDRAINATEVLPGLNLLPDVLPLCGFLSLYIALVGPLNYLVLRRINRREYAWVTIPVFILLFSALSWLVGFNLRGNEVTFSRLALVQSWPDHERAQVNGLVGILSPRRSNYTLSMADNSLLRPLARNLATNPLVANVQASTDIQQAGNFRADNFSVDASFIATFNTSTFIERPAISGQVSMFYQREPDAADHWALRGSISNDSGFTLHNPVILARGTRLELEEALAPGDVQTFELVLDNSQPPASSPLEQRIGETRIGFGFSRQFDPSASEQSVRDILGDEAYNRRAVLRGQSDSAETQENHRRQLLLTALMMDQYQATARGNRVFLAGWADEMPLNTDLADTVWQPVDTTLHIIELDVDVVKPAGTIRITADQFTWMAQERPALATDLAPVNGFMQFDDVAVFRFTPLPEMVLAEVEVLYLTLDSRSNMETYPVELWDWQDQSWRLVSLPRVEGSVRINARALRNPDRYLGAQNMVQLRLSGDGVSSGLAVTEFAVEQEGRF
jgi:hypothetical protein